MKLTITGRQMNVYDEMKELIAKKLTKFDKYFNGDCDATVTLSCKHNKKYIELTISAANTLFRSEVGAESFRDALDDAIETIEGQIRKNKTRLARRLRSGGMEFAPADLMDYEDDEEPEDIITPKPSPSSPCLRRKPFCK